MQWDYGDRDRGLSFEHVNLWDALRRVPGIDARHFDFMAAFQEGGHDAVRSGLLNAVDEFHPHLLFAVLFRDEMPRDVLAQLRDRSDLTTFNWFCDDHWRFEDFSQHYAPLFNAVSTTALSALPKYRAIGYDNVIKTQWGCNHWLYRPTTKPVTYDVSFVGQPHGDREQVIAALEKRNIHVNTWGYGWPNGRLDQAEMIEVFGRSKINLNLSNASVKPRFSVPWSRQHEQIKGRNFEIPGCGGFQISGRADDLESYFAPGQEIVLFSSRRELVQQTQRYLRDESARERIALAGLRRTLSEHTYERRFLDIFAKLDLL